MSGPRHRYGPHRDQWGELHRPAGPSRGVVVVIHGGFWKAAYTADLGRPLAEDLARRGWTAWNLEYRREAPGGHLATLDDVAAGLDHLAGVPGLDLARVVTLGHSAGGHLAVWAAARGRFARWRPTRVAVTGVVSQAGVLDLGAAAELGLGTGAVDRFLGRPWGSVSATERSQVDPIRQVPVPVPVRCIHAADDEDVPIRRSADYVSAAREAGGDVSLEKVAGDHYTLIDPASAAWSLTLRLLEAL